MLNPFSHVQPVDSVPAESTPITSDVVSAPETASSSCSSAPTDVDEAHAQNECRKEETPAPRRRKRTVLCESCKKEMERPPKKKRSHKWTEGNTRAFQYCKEKKDMQIKLRHAQQEYLEAVLKLETEKETLNSDQIQATEKQKQEAMSTVVQCKAELARLDKEKQERHAAKQAAAAAAAAAEATVVDEANLVSSS